MEIYEKIRYYREHTDYSQRNVAKILGVSRNTVKKHREGQTVPWERKHGSSTVLSYVNSIAFTFSGFFAFYCEKSEK